MKEPYLLNLKDFHEFSWVVAALNFFKGHYQLDYSPDALGDCYYNTKEAEEMFNRIEEDFLEYHWETHKEKDDDGEYYCAFEDNLDPDAFPCDWMVEYYDKEVGKRRAKDWYLCNTTMEANFTKIALQLESFSIEEALHDTKLYGDACHRSLTKDEVLLCVDDILKKNKEFYRTEEGKKWLNSDD